MKKVVSAKANDDFTLDIQFNDGSVKRFDAKPYLDYPVFRELKDVNRFGRNIKIVFGTCNGNEKCSKTSARKLCIWKAEIF